MSFSDEPSSPLFKEWKILKIKDIVEIHAFSVTHFSRDSDLNHLMVFIKDVVTLIQQDSVDLSVNQKCEVRFALC